MLTTAVAVGAGLASLVAINGLFLVTPLSWALIFVGPGLAMAPYIVIPVALGAAAVLVGVPSALTAVLVDGGPAALGAFAGTLGGATVGAVVGFGVFWALYAAELQQRSRRTQPVGDEDFPGLFPGLAFGGVVQVSTLVGVGVGTALVGLAMLALMAAEAPSAVGWIAFGAATVVADGTDCP